LPPNGQNRDASIWFFAFGYFACYAPYSAMTKALTKGWWPGMESGLTGFQLLPATVLSTTVGMIAFLTAMRWWRYAGRGPGGLPWPGRWTFLSGLCTAGVIGTTTLAYTFDGVSIVFVMLLMRGGVLVLAPIVDAVSKRHVRWFSWAGLVLSLGALVVAFSEDAAWNISAICAVDVLLYLACYFVRFRFMSKLAKSEDGNANKRFFVEEQMVAAPALLLLLVVGALIGRGEILGELRYGFTTFFTEQPIVLEALLVGLFSQGTGIFGSLIFLDRRENTYCIPVNRSSSVLAGVVASYALMMFPAQRAPSSFELLGAGLIIAAILFLSIPPMLARRPAAVAAAAAEPAPARARAR
jgi:hypothetical protein